MAVTSLFREEHSEMLRRVAQARKMIACSPEHVVGLKADGTVLAIGNNRSGQCNVSNWKNITQVAAAEGVTVGLRRDGTVVTTRSSWQEPVASWRNIIDVTVSTSGILGLQKNGNIVQASYVNRPGGSFPGAERLFGNQLFGAGIRNDGTVVPIAVDPNYRMDLSRWSGIVDAMALVENAVGLLANGTVVTQQAEFADSTSKNLLGQASRWQDILALFGSDNILGLKADGTLLMTQYDGDDFDDESYEEDFEEEVFGDEYSDGDFLDDKETVERWLDVLAAASDGNLTVALHGDGTVSVCAVDPEIRPTVMGAENWKLFDEVPNMEDHPTVPEENAEELRQQEEAARRRQEAAAHRQRANEERTRLAAEIAKLQGEKSRLGMFAFKEKKELDERISLLRLRLDRM